MTGKSLLPILTSGKSGRVEPDRSFVVVGRERHVSRARLKQLPYPQRAIRTDDYLYIRNFKPERWPMGTAPGYGLAEGEFASENSLTNNTFTAFGDLDASPTKAWLILNRNKQGMQRYFDYAFGLRPEIELYDLKNDPDQFHNVAGQKEYAATQAKLSSQLMNVLKKTGDPRVTR